MPGALLVSVLRVMLVVVFALVGVLQLRPVLGVLLLFVVSVLGVLQLLPVPSPNP